MSEQAYNTDAVRAQVAEWQPDGGFADRKNAYECEECASWIVTVDREQGVTPFMVVCGNCGSMAKSKFYRVSEHLTPTHEWYRPDTLDGLSEWSADHVRKGGLLLREIGGGDAKDGWQKSDPEEIVAAKREAMIADYSRKIAEIEADQARRLSLPSGLPPRCDAAQKGPLMTTTPNQTTREEISGDPVAWLFESENGDRELLFNPNGERAVRMLTEFGYVAQPLYAAALQSPTEGDRAWRPIESAPKDGTRVLLLYSPKDQEYRLHRHAQDRVFEGWHEGKTESGYDLGWALYPGFGGVGDKSLAGWMPLPEAPAHLSRPIVGENKEKPDEK